MDSPQNGAVPDTSYVLACWGCGATFDPWLDEALRRVWRLTCRGCGRVYVSGGEERAASGPVAGPKGTSTRSSG